MLSVEISVPKRLVVEQAGSKVRHAGRSFVPMDQSTQPGRLKGSQRLEVWRERKPRRNPEDDEMEAEGERGRRES